MSKEVGQKLVELRGERRAEQVANDLGIPVRTLKSYEQGERTPKDDLKTKIAHYYNVSIEWLFFDHFDHYKCPLVHE
ncbi:helix-turn-helix transcriptional regulator [Paenibacillus sp. 3LSP]|uniref:helix-turn-helix transcriptional regulator n=1 Tax=Paenibacillus sp. 3LSP TaxID=2800795 RepID=UPI0003A28872|nr:helix-turn-helix transcriptional regulator [Paenibacillus sp. 3LSP]MDU0330508.1 helix-turn-helix transcriptional regulator [Paenibacillus sp. 3LSP]